MNVLMTSNTSSKEIYLEVLFRVTNRLIKCLIDKWAPFFQYRSDPGFRKHGFNLQVFIISKNISFVRQFWRKFFMISICFKDSCSSTEEIWRSLLAKLTWERISHHKTTLFKHKLEISYFLCILSACARVFVLFAVFNVSSVANFTSASHISRM